MCLPLGCLKCIVEFEAWIILLGGIGCFIYTIVLQVQYSKALNDDVDKTFGQGLLDAFWIFSSCIIVNGIFGVVGGKKKSACLLFLFNLVNMAIFLGFLVLMILSYIWAGKIDSPKVYDRCNNGTSNMNAAQLLGEDILCQSCQCYYNNSLPLPASYTNVTSNSSAPSRVQDCPEFDDVFSNSQQFYANSLGYYEKNYDCTGWCSPYGYEIFHNINDIPSNQSLTCQSIAQQKLKDQSMLMGDISAGLTGLMGLMVIFTFCLCCHPEKKEQEFYKRLAYYDEA